MKNIPQYKNGLDKKLEKLPVIFSLYSIFKTKHLKFLQNLINYPNMIIISFCHFLMKIININSI